MSRSEANLIQHGGAHYMLKEYQHWDWVSDIGMHYLHGCATKYPSRWRDKGGVQDLKKAIHYVDKAVERGIPAIATPDDAGRRAIELTEKYISQLPLHEGEAIMAIVQGEWAKAKHLLHQLIETV